MRKKAEGKKGIALTKKELAELTGLSYRRIFDINTDLPQDKKLFVPAENGKYDLATFVRRWISYSVEKNTTEEMSLDAAKTIHEQVKIQKSQTELARMRGELVEVTEVQQAWVDIATTVRQSITTLPQKIAPKVYMVDNMNIVIGLIDEEITEVLNNIADTPIRAAETPGKETEAEEEE